MAKLNEELKSKLVFGKYLFELDGMLHVKVFCHHGELYRQYVYVDNGTGTTEEKDQLEEEARNILTQVIQSELNKA